MKPEDRIKSALINHLIEIGFLTNEDLILSEYSLPEKNRRIDIALFKADKAYAFEIKSEKDSLKRLPGQIKDISTAFDKTIVIYEKRHENSILSELETNIGAWLFTDNKFIKKRRGKLSNNNHSQMEHFKECCEFLDKTAAYEKISKKFIKRKLSFWKARSLEPKQPKLELAAITHGIPKSLRKESNTDTWNRILSTSD